MRAGTNNSRFIRIVGAAGLVAASAAGCNSQPSGSSSPAVADDTAPINVTLSYRPSGTVALSWDRQSQNVTATLQMAGFMPGGTYAVDIYHGGCAAMGDIAVPFPEVTADGGGAINTTITGERLVPGGLIPDTALAMHLNAEVPLGNAQIPCGDITAADLTTTLAMAPVGQPPQGEGHLAYNPGAKTLAVATSATGLAPGSTHAQFIGFGACEAQGTAMYPLDDLVASANGTAYQTTVIQDVDQAPPPSGWYLNVQLGSSAEVLQDGQPTPYSAPIICGNIGGSESKS